MAFVLARSTVNELFATFSSPYNSLCRSPDAVAEGEVPACVLMRGAVTDLFNPL